MTQYSAALVGLTYGEMVMTKRQAVLAVTLSILVVAVVVLTADAIFAQGMTMSESFLDRRLNSLEAQNLDGRLRVLESDMFEVKWLSRTVTAAMIANFIATGMQLRRKQS